MQTEVNQNNSFLYKKWGKIHRGIYYVFIILFAISLPTSEFVMSVSMFALFGNWLLDIFLANKLYHTPLQKKLLLFRKNKTALVLFSLFLIHIIGIAYSEDLKHAIKDIRIKLPIGVFALIISTEIQLSAKKIRTILLLFVLTVFTSTLISVTYYLTHDILNMRDISLFISHIRFGLMISFSIYMIFYLLLKNNYPNYVRLLLFLIVPWLLFYLIFAENLTGFLITTFIGFLLLIRTLVKAKNKFIKFASLAFLLAASILTIFFMKDIYQDVFITRSIDLHKLEKLTVNGNSYKHKLENKQSENGYLVWIYLSGKELEKEWNKRSKIKYWKKDRMNQELRFTLIRYLTSKGYRKDSVGVNKLSQQDIAAIENGIPNYKFLENSSLRNRLHKIFWEIKNYINTDYASGHSLTMRFEYWKTGVEIIKDHPLFGVGTGEIYPAYKSKYRETNSKLDKKWRYLSHNQFIYITVSLGIFGLLWFLFTLFYPIIAERKYNYFPYVIFFIIVMLSFLTEDTLTTQAGVCFFAFFNALLLFNPKKDK